MAGRWGSGSVAVPRTAGAVNVGGLLIACGLLVVDQPGFEWHHGAVLCALVAISAIGFFAQVDLKLQAAAYFGADLFLALLALALAGPIAALAVWAVPEFLARFVMRRDPMLSPGLVATVTSFVFAVLAGQAVLTAASPTSPDAAAPALYTAGLVMCLVNFVFARLLFAPFYQRIRPSILIRSEFFRLAPLFSVMLAIAIISWLLIPALGVLALAPLAFAVIAPQVAFTRLARRRSVANIARLDAQKLYASAIGDMLGLSRDDRRVLECASELAAERHKKWRFEDAMRYSQETLAAAIPIALHSEERWDGAGEPAHLEGHQAPLGSRILAVARRWSALTARGTPALPHVEAMLGLAALSGSELDPAVVRAAQRVVAQEEIFIGAPDFEPRLHRLPLPRAARRGAVPALLGKMAAAQ